MTTGSVQAVLPRLIVAGTHSGCGKTSMVAAILGGLSAQGHKILPGKTGPDYIDPAFHSRISGMPARNLDSWLLEPETLVKVLVRAFQTEEAELAVIEGVMGLFDGAGNGHPGSTAHLAGILQAPVVLVVNARGMSRSLAAVVKGYHEFLPGLRLAGVLLNRVSGPAQYASLKEMVLDACNLPCFGFLPESARFSLPSRHLGLLPPEEIGCLDQRLETLSQAGASHIDLEGLARLARSAPPLPFREEIPMQAARRSRLPSRSPLRLGVARDKAFSFYYQDNLDLLRSLGAELVFFSPLEDPDLPGNLHGLYLGGGFPEVFAQRLQDNQSFRIRLKIRLEEGLPCYAECGGLLYLCRRIYKEGRQEDSHELTGFFPFEAIMTGKLQTFGYAKATLLQDTILGRAGELFRVHEFHYSRLIPSEGSLDGRDGSMKCGTIHPTYRMEKDDGRSWQGGLARKNTLGAFGHLHFHSCPQAADHFLRICAKFRDSSG